MTLIGKMQRRLERDASNKTAERVNDEIEASGKDGLELAARVCAVAYKGVKERLPANRDYRTGYAMALAELAVVLRGMRRGEHPRADEMADARRGVVGLIEAEFDGQPAPFVVIGTLYCSCPRSGGGPPWPDEAGTACPECGHMVSWASGLTTREEEYWQRLGGRPRTTELARADDILREQIPDPRGLRDPVCPRCNGTRRVLGKGFDDAGLSFPCPECAS